MRIGKRGTVVLPTGMRRRFGLDEGSTVLIESTDEGILLRPAVVLPVEAYTPARKAEFLLNNAVDLEDYRRAVQEVRGLGINPEDVPHEKPTRR
ncbi:MAG TPA: AbrB/MazE/SpoVT family DNA-binding domain-containing protein [Longimicrobium sp.]